MESRHADVLPPCDSAPDEVPTGRCVTLPRRGYPRTGLMALCLLASVAATGGAAAQATPEDWPCVQVLVPELSAGILWPRPLGESAAGWRDDAELRALAERLGDTDTYDETLQRAVREFAGAAPEDERAIALDRLAAGTVAVADARRRDYIDGIRRYTRQQIAVAAQIEDGLNRIAAIEDGEAASLPPLRDRSGRPVDLSDPALRAEFEETLRWHERVFDERERALPRLCEQPVELEQTLSTVLRDMAQYLP